MMYYSEIMVVCECVRVCVLETVSFLFHVCVFGNESGMGLFSEVATLTWNQSAFSGFFAAY